MSFPSNPGGPDRNLLRQSTQEDMLAQGLKVGLGLLGPLGVVFGEFVAQFVPQQRMDRLTNFVEKLQERIDDFEAYQRRVREPAYAALVESATVAAVQTPSDERRRDLAALLKHGLPKTDEEMLDEHALLRLLQELSDPEVLVLAYYRVAYHSTMGNPAPGLFRKRHPQVLDVFPSTYGSSPDERRRWMMYEHYENRLLRLGLLEEAEGAAKSSVRRLEITGIGIMLIEAIDREPEGTKEA